ncbi:helix-turn-helix transcriptional regulator [Pedobacter aquatilis]|uniref:helix-turn-helix domain-containing protein n=1 Tax=Pedobacter aquatilis TaxID=351343 RepID=UPI0025B3602F|nr:helix-turn-helix transcriptional regulator [Pedobacter aquatilis]MDN3587722.1 helix-turn-helix transcriptional regulator [Pedobacter aquatilis]
MGQDMRYQIIGDKIRSRRIELHITQNKMAAMLNIATGTYSKNEKQVKDIPLERLFHIALILNMTAEEIIVP